MRDSTVRKDALPPDQYVGRSRHDFAADDDSVTAIIHGEDAIVSSTRSKELPNVPSISALRESVSRPSMSTFLRTGWQSVPTTQ